MRLTFITFLLLGSFFAFSRDMEPGSEYYDLSVQLVTNISNLEFSSCPTWTSAVVQQEFLCASFSGDARNFPSAWDSSLAAVSSNYNLEDALDWNTGALGINKMYSINDSIMSVTLEPQGNRSQLVIYVAKPLSVDDFAVASTNATTSDLQSISVAVPGTITQSIQTPTNSLSNGTTDSSGSNIIIQAVPRPNSASSDTTNTASPSTSSNPSANFSDVATSTDGTDYYGYPTYEAYVEAYRLKVTNPASSQPSAQQQATSIYSNSLPAYCATYPSRPECNPATQQPVQSAANTQQAALPFPNTPASTPAQTTTNQSFNGYPSYEAYLQAFRERHAQGTQTAQSTQSYLQNNNSQQSQSYLGFPSYEAYLQDYNQRYGQAGQVATPNITTPNTVTSSTTTTLSSTAESSTTEMSSSTATTPSTSTAATQTTVVPTTTETSTTTSSSSSSESSEDESTASTENESNISSSFQVSASSLTNTSASDSTDAESNTSSPQILSLATEETTTSSGPTSVLGKITTRGFRNVPWGATPVRTKAIETWELVDEGLAKDEAYYLAYDGEILGTKVLAVYYFSPKTKILGRGAYIFMGADEENTLQVTRHTSLHNMLGDDYGSPNRNEKLWLNEDAEELDMSDFEALEAGEMLYVTQWDDDQIDVELSLFASADELMNRILYSSKLFSVVIDTELN